VGSFTLVLFVRKVVSCSFRQNWQHSRGVIVRLQASKVQARLVSGAGTRVVCLFHMHACIIPFPEHCSQHVAGVIRGHSLRRALCV
jgi:hypothetical protein